MDIQQNVAQTSNANEADEALKPDTNDAEEVPEFLQNSYDLTITTIFRYVGKQGELSFEGNEQIRLTDHPNDAGWWYATNEKDETGLLPKYYFDPSIMAIVPLAIKEPSRTRSARKGVLKATFSYIPCTWAEILFHTNEKLDIYRHEALQEGWVIARNSYGKIGLIPEFKTAVRFDPRSYRMRLNVKNAPTSAEMTTQWSFQSGNWAHLSHKRHEKLIIMKNHPAVCNSWSIAKNGTGQIGLIPNSYDVEDLFPAK